MEIAPGVHSIREENGGQKRCFLLGDGGVRTNRPTPSILVLGRWGSFGPGREQLVVGETRIECCSADVESLRLTLARLRPAWLVISPIEDEATVQTLVMMSWQSYPELRLAMLAGQNDLQRCERWMRRGCHVFLSCQSSITRTLAILSAATEHDVLVVDRLFYLQWVKSRHISFLPCLTTRQTEVLDLVSRGLTNPEIASALHISGNTVEFHVRHVLAQLGARNRTEAVVRARHLGLT